MTKPPLLERQALAVYVVLTLGIVWTTAPLALVSPAGHGLLNAFNPLLVALGVTAATAGRHGVAALLRRLLIWRVGLRWYLVVVGLPLMIALAAVGISMLAGLPVGNPFDRISTTTATLLLFIWVIAPGEELGWRGFALPRLLARTSAVQAALVLGAVGVAFHLSVYVLPLLVPGHPAPGMTLPAFVLQYLGLGIAVTWIFIHTRGSVLIACVFHGVFDIVGNLTLLALDPVAGPWLWTGTVAIVSLLLVARLGPELGSRRSSPAPIAGALRRKRVLGVKRAG